MTKSSTFHDTTSLQDIEADCWAALEQAMTDRDSGFRLLSLGTVNGAEVAQRTVVLRKVDRAAGELFIHTDCRSTKVSQLTANPNASLLFYDPSSKVQLRATTTASLHIKDGVADEMWQNESATSLKGYLGGLPPGTRTSTPDHNLPEEWIQNIPSRDVLKSARDNFAVVRFVVKTLLWLKLDRNGHLQAHFDYADDRSFEANWMTP